MATMEERVRASTPRIRARQPQPRSAQVIVIGAGLSGLQAALETQNAGLTSLVLDASDRVGGSIAPPVYVEGHGYVDVSGHRFKPAEHVRTRSLATDLDVGLAYYFDGGNPSNLGAVDLRSFTRVRDNLEQLCGAVDINCPSQFLPNYGSMTVHELVVSHGATSTVRNMANKWTSTLFGRSSKDVGALYFLLHCKSLGGVQNAISGTRGSIEGLSLCGGAWKLCHGLAERLRTESVCLSQAVVRIEQTRADLCTITTLSGDVFYCSHVILAVPPATYSYIEFSPPLNQDKRWLSAHTSQSFRGQVAAVYTEPWWRNKKLSTYDCTANGPFYSFTDSSNNADGIYSLILSAADDDEGHQFWFERTEIERRLAIIDFTSKLFETSAPAPSATVELDPALGVSAATLCVPAANLKNLERDHWQAEGNLHFAGSDTSHVWRGEMEGALAAGSRGAREVLEVLRPSETELQARL